MSELETGALAENLAPDAVAPRTGPYVCGYRVPGGIAEDPAAVLPDVRRRDRLGPDVGLGRGAAAAPGRG